MDKRVTITDIARMCSVSPGTVHRALNGKPGVGEALRERILEAARQSGYRPNSVASSLKRKPLRIVAAFLGPTEQNRYFFTQIWQGFRDYMAEIGDYNVEVVELPYYYGYNRQEEELDAALEQYGDSIDGMITVGNTDPRVAAAIDRYIQRGIPVVLVVDDHSCDRLACVQTSYEMAGAVIAEQLAMQAAKGSTIAVLAGDVMMPGHSRVVQGMDHYLREFAPHLRVAKVHGYLDMDDVRGRLGYLLNKDSAIGAACAVTARCSVALGEVLQAAGLAGKIPAIGSDVFEENARFLREGTLSNIIYKAPHQQAYLGTKVLMDYLIRDEKPHADTIYVNSTLVFRSNLSIYENGHYRNIL